MHRIETAGLAYYTFDRLAAVGLTHAVVTRRGGMSQPPFNTLNIGHTVGDSPVAVAQNLVRLHSSLGLDPDHTVTAHQVHGDRVVAVDRAGWGSVVAAADGLVTATTQTTLLLRFADCVPIFLVDLDRGAIGLGHAGWRGTAEAIAARLVEAMAHQFGSEPASLLAGLGPGIAPHHYPVSAAVARRVAAALPHPDGALRRENGSFHLDLWEANRQQLVAAGVKEPELMPLCTSCHPGDFYSHRGEGPITGRFAALVALEP